MSRLSIILLIGAVLTVSLTYSQEVTKKQCRSEFSVQNRKQLGWINECVKKLGYKTGREKTQKSTCIWKCVLNNLQMLNSDGYVDVASYDKYLIDEWSQGMLNRANVTFQPCLKIGGSETDTTDEFCKGYDPLIKCLTRNFSNLCKGL